MKRTLIAAALAAISLAAVAPVARADQNYPFTIVGVGHLETSFLIGGQEVKQPGIDCTRAAGAAQTGDCDETAVDGPGFCNEQVCFPATPGAIRVRAIAIAGSGFTFAGFSHVQCGAANFNPCGISAPLGVNPPFPVTATFTDNQAPTATLTAPADGAAVRGTIPLTATASDNSGVVSSLVFRVGGNPFQTFEVAPFATNLDTRTRPDGPLTITATATDPSNRTNVSTANVVVDNTNPTLTVTGPNNQTFGPGATPTWAIAANDATSDFGVRCSVVPAGQPAAFGACTSNTQERLVNPADGRYTLTVRVMDLAGNFVEQTRAFAVDTGPPNTTITSGPDDGATTNETSLTWGLGATEPGSTFECRLFLSAIGTGPFTPCSAAASHTVAGLTAGTYTFEARATDVFGNADPTPVRRTVTVVLQAPPAPPPVVRPVIQPVIQPVIFVTLTFSFHDANKKTTRISALNVNSVPAGSTVTARCPKGCAKKSWLKNNAKGNVSLKALAGKKPLKAKTKITVTVSKPGAVSAVKVLVVQKSKAPTVQSLCQAPGAKAPGPCA